MSFVDEYIQFYGEEINEDIATSYEEYEKIPALPFMCI